VSPTRPIAFVAPRLAGSGAAGGAETLIKSLAERAARSGRQVHLLTTCATNHFTWKNDLPAGTRQEGPLTIHCFPVDGGRDLNRFGQAQERISRGRFNLQDEEAWLAESVNSRALLDFLAAQPFDRIVVGPYLFGLTVAVCRRFPKQAFLLPCLHDEAFARVSLFKSVFENSAGILFNSEPEKQLAMRLYGLPASKGCVVGMGLDPFEADPGAFARKHALTAPYVVYCGRREPLKGTPLLFDYMTAFRARTGRDVKLVLTGSGQVPIPAPLRAHVLDVGFVSELEKHEAMAGATAFCHPSLNESFSIVLLEAWLARTPALVRETCAVLRDHCVRSNGGLWFSRYPEFEEALSLLLDRNELRMALGAAGRAYVEREYSWPAVERKLFAALEAPLSAG
jgi:glycosyltransferase involved in cell wall biosynthesis